MPKKKPRIDHIRPEIPKVPDVREPEPFLPEPILHIEPDDDKPDGVFDYIKAIVLSTVIPFIRKNARVTLSVDTHTRTAVVIVSVLGKEILRKAVKF